MACDDQRYTITTGSHANWNGTLVISNGQATFQGDSVSVDCGQDANGEWIQFEHSGSHHAHYHKAHRGSDGKFHGACDDDSPKKDTDNWTATPTTFPDGGRHEHHEHHEHHKR